jgi:hypothetical protein
VVPPRLSMVLYREIQVNIIAIRGLHKNMQNGNQSKYSFEVKNQTVTVNVKVIDEGIDVLATATLYR